MNKKIMDRYMNENMDSRTRYHNKVPEDMYHQANKTELSYKIDHVKNNSVQKYMSEIKGKEKTVNTQRLD